ncbi:MAG TPA: CPBP family intramembrane glutamic endopeptidase [Chloroflexia bacterium]|nr:CPBP family intramembrane glutamic endopeptidase [Chloroflexia bacterium]
MAASVPAESPARPAKDYLGTYTILTPILLNIGGLIIYSGYYALRYAAPGTVAGIPVGYVWLATEALILLLEWVLALSIIVRWRRSGVSLRERIAPPGRIHWGPALALFLSWNGIFAVYLGLATRLYGDLTQSYAGLPGGVRLVLIVVLPLSAAFTEELIWRGYIITRLAARGYGARAVVGLSALSFAAIHGIYLPDKLIVTFLIGVIAAWYFRREQHLGVLMVTHWFLDLWSFGLLLWALS